MKRLSALILTFMILLSLGGSIALAQHQQSATPTQASTSEAQADSMQDCLKQHAEGVAALDRATTSLAQAQGLSDASQMKAAIESAQQQLTKAKHDLSTCPMRDMSGRAHSQHPQNKMKCMSGDSQPE